MSEPNYVRWFSEIRLEDGPIVGAKNAWLGELYSVLSSEGLRVPNGFALTAQSYRDALTAADAWGRLNTLLERLACGEGLAERAAAARQLIYDATSGEDLRKQIVAAYRKLEADYGAGVAVAVRSSAPAEDLPIAGFDGLFDSFINVRGESDVIEACRRSFASLFTDRGIVYRLENGLDQFKAALSVGVMKMVRSDIASSGAIVTLDTESGFRDVVFVTGAYGPGMNKTRAQSDADAFYVHKPTFRKGFRAVLSHSLGRKQAGMAKPVAIGEAKCERYCITDAEILSLADIAIKVEDHFSARAGHPVPMDIEWAKDGEDGRLYILQARPETVASERPPETFEIYALQGKGALLASGRAVGEKIASGKVRVVSGAEDLAEFQPGEVFVCDATTPDWDPVMKTAAAIVTNRGSRASHAAIVARELGVPAVVGTAMATKALKPGVAVTVSCAEGGTGRVYEGEIPFGMTRVAAASLPRPRTEIKVNLSDPALAFKAAMLPNDGVGLARMEFIISEHIGVHPMALAEPERVTSEADRTIIAKLTAGYQRPVDFFIERLSEGLGTIAAAFYPKPVNVRFSDFKTSEYAKLIGGADFEPKEENPMIGFRGASRYTHPAYAAGFALECAALKRVRDQMGLTNLLVMVPFCRRVEEARRVISAMTANGLRHGERGLKIYVMCEVPNNVISIDAFAEWFDGFSIGSNDLTQLTLGVDRNSDIVAFEFDERDAGMLAMFRLAITGAKRNGRRVGICGEAPANYPEIARFLTELGIDSISVNPASIMRTMTVMRHAEDLAKRGPGDAAS